MGQRPRVAGVAEVGHAGVEEDRSPVGLEQVGGDGDAHAGAGAAAGCQRALIFIGRAAGQQEEAYTHGSHLARGCFLTPAVV